MRISIVVPTYNSATYLEKLLENIVAERFKDLEVIIIDGYSNDGTNEVVARYGKYVTHYVSEPDSGQAEAVTKGLRLATGEVVHWHAADDLIVPGALCRVAKIFDSNPLIDLVYSDGLAIFNNKLVMTGRCRHFSRSSYIYHFGRFQSDCAYWRRELTAQALPLDSSMPLNVDEDFFLRIIAKSRVMRWLDTPLGIFRVRPGQISQTLAKHHLKQDRLVSKAKIYTMLRLSAKQVIFRKMIWLLPHAFASIVMANLYIAITKVQEIFGHRDLKRVIYEDIERYL